MRPLSRFSLTFPASEKILLIRGLHVQYRRRRHLLHRPGGVGFVRGWLGSEWAGLQLPGRIVDVVGDARALAGVLPKVVAIGLAGSWARGQARPDSDVDIVLLTEQPGAALAATSWFSTFGDDTVLVRSADFGAIQERRLRLPDGLLVEVGIGTPDWAWMDPVDAGTERVVRDGIVTLYNPRVLLAALRNAVAPTR